MTENEWLTCSDPIRMLKFIEERISSRKLSLYSVACARKDRLLLKDKLSKRAIDWSEKFADKTSKPNHKSAPTDEDCLQMPKAANLCFAVGLFAYYGNIDGAFLTTIDLLKSLQENESEESSKEVAEEQADLLRIEFFGNPFQSNEMRPYWRNSEGTSLAETIYKKKDFTLSEPLADALQSAGCNQLQILDHLREHPNHSRGCWAIDLILGKE